MSWGALSVRALSFAVVLPVALSKLGSAEVSAWLLFSTVASLQMLIDFGFSGTFSREISYALAGRSTTRMGMARHDCSVGSVSDATIPEILATLRWLYLRLGLITFVLLAVAGSFAVATPIARTTNPAECWMAWAIVVVATSIAVYGSANSCALIGADRIYLQKRWETALGLLLLLAQLAALLRGGGLLALVTVTQLGSACIVVTNGFLTKSAFRDIPQTRISHAAAGQHVARLWPAAWRTAIGSMASFGVAQGIVIVAANILSAGEAATAQLGIRLAQILSQYSQVPFYTKIPRFNRLHAQRAPAELSVVATRSTRLSLNLFAITSILVAAAAPKALEVFGSKTRFPTIFFWGLLSLAYLVERIGAMHVQLLLTQNRVIAHYTNTTTALFWLATLALLWPSMGVNALPASMLVAYVLIYTPVSAFISHRTLPEAGGWRYEVRTAALPLALLLSLLASAIFLPN